MQKKPQQSSGQTSGRESYFPRFSDIIDLRRFERENRRRLYRGFGFAVIVLILGAVLWHPPAGKKLHIPEQPYRTIKTDIIEMPIQHYSEPFKIRKPAMTRHFPQRPSGMRMPSGNIATKTAPLPFEEASIPPIPPNIESAPTPETNLRKQSFFPVRPEYETRISRRIERRLSLEEEGLTLDGLDSLGVYEAWLIHDPTDKKNVKGFAYIPGMILGVPPGYIRLENAVSGLIETANLFCNIEFKADIPVSFSSGRLFQYPVVFITSAADSVFDPGSRQIQRFGDYLRQGGFAIVDNGAPWYDFSPAEASLLNILIHAVGKDARFEPIPADHPLFTCFFDCSVRLPPGAKDRATPVRKNQYEVPVMNLRAEAWELQMGVFQRVWRNQIIMPRLKDLGRSMWGGILRDPDIEILHRSIRAAPESIWGVWIEDKMVAVYLDRGYGHLWQ
jgi:hypothetical protein